MKREHFYDLIEAHLLGKLSPQQRQAFELEVLRNPDLAEQFEAQQHEHEAMEVLVEDRLRAQLRRWSEQHPLRPAWWGMKTVLSIAAALALLLVVGYLLRRSGEVATPPELAVDAPAVSPPPPPATTPTDAPTEAPALPPPSESKGASPPPAVPTAQQLALSYLKRPHFQPLNVRGEEEAESHPLSPVYALLAEKKYTKATALLEQIDATHPQYITAQHLLGEIHIARQRYVGAIPYLKVVVRQEDYLRRKEAEWQLSLMYLYCEQIEEARQLLQRIRRDEEHPYQKKAHRLLGNMDRLLSK